MRTPISVALLGRNSIAREGLRRILAEDSFKVTQSVDHPSHLSDGDDPDDLLVVVDGELEAGDADGLRALHCRFPTVKLVVLSDAFDFGLMMNAFHAGAYGYIVKEISCEPFIGSLRLVAMGEKVMPSHLVTALPAQDMRQRQEAARSMLERANLSIRERETLSCLIMGCSNKVISRRLAISEATVKVHVNAILRKLRVQNRTQAAIRGVNGGLEDHLGTLPGELELVTVDGRECADPPHGANANTLVAVPNAQRDAVAC